MKTYLEIIDSCKFVNYQEDSVRTETWQDTDWEYECVWFPSNEGAIPSTIYTNELEECAYCGIRSSEICDSIPSGMCERAINTVYMSDLNKAINNQKGLQ